MDRERAGDRDRAAPRAAFDDGARAIPKSRAHRAILNDEYYNDLDHAAASNWARVGWRQQIEQAYRFEVALELVRACDGPVLDVGAGLGALARYAAECGVHRDWWAVEPRHGFAKKVREAGRYARVLESSFEDLEPLEVGCAVAIGVLTAGTSVTVAQLASFLAQAPASVFTALDRAAIAQRPLLAAEHESAASSIIEITDVVGEQGRVVPISSTDLAAFQVRDFVPRSIAERFEATVDGPWGDEPPELLAWLACELGLVERAEHWLAKVSGDVPLAELVRARLALS